MNKTDTQNVPQLFSESILSNNFIFVSGQIHMNPEGKVIEGSTDKKLEQIMNNISYILNQSNLDLNNVVKLTIYFTDILELKFINEAYSKYFNSRFPVREAICVSALPLGASIEISVIAEVNK